MLEEIIERTRLTVDPWAEHRQSEAPHTSSVLWIQALLISLTLGVIQGCSLERVRYGWDHLNGICDRTPFRVLYKLLRFWWVGAEIYLSRTTQDKPYIMLPCLLNLQPTNLKWSVSPWPPCSEANLWTNNLMTSDCWIFVIFLPDFYFFCHFLNLK